MGCFLFFFQAEDGIRDLVRSRGLGDVYKRQVTDSADGANRTRRRGALRALRADGPSPLPVSPGGRGSGAVSYTHLTLPTSDLV